MLLGLYFVSQEFTNVDYVVCLSQSGDLRRPEESRDVTAIILTTPGPAVHGCSVVGGNVVKNAAQTSDLSQHPTITSFLQTLPY